MKSSSGKRRSPKLPPMRDYTPRYDAGPATAWALRARDGDPLMVRGAVSSVIFLSNFFEPG
jgi:NADPH-dependent ferric siderophore reductase